MRTVLCLAGLGAVMVGGAVCMVFAAAAAKTVALISETSEQ